MMNRLHCTYTELRDEPHEEMVIFNAFVAGESAAEKQLRDQKT